MKLLQQLHFGASQQLHFGASQFLMFLQLLAQHVFIVDHFKEEKS